VQRFTDLRSNELEKNELHLLPVVDRKTILPAVIGFHNLPSFVDGTPVTSYPIMVFAICFRLATYAHFRSALFEWISAVVFCGNHNLANLSILYDAEQSIRRFIRSIVYYVDIEQNVFIPVNANKSFPFGENTCLDFCLCTHAFQTD
jgi:hypothetical protein